MKSTINTSSEGNFPYGNQPNYREFLISKPLLVSFEEHELSNNSSSDPRVIARYFNPVGSHTWYATQYDDIQEIFYGYVTGGHCPEWGYFGLKDFIDLALPWGTKIERDLYFTSGVFREVVPEAEQRIS